MRLNLRNLLRGPAFQHTVPVASSDEFGGTREVTCQEIQNAHGVHFNRTVVVDAMGGTMSTTRFVPCHMAEEERQRLLLAAESHESTVNRLNDIIRDLQDEVANCRRWLTESFQVVFHMGPALKNLVQDDLGNPALTDDKSAVKLGGLLYTVVIDIINEQLHVRDVNGVVPELSLSIFDGHLSEEAQTLIIGTVERIKRAQLGDRTDPVTGAVNLVQAPAAS